MSSDGAGSTLHRVREIAAKLRQAHDEAKALQDTNSEEAFGSLAFLCAMALVQAEGIIAGSSPNDGANLIADGVPPKTG